MHLERNQKILLSVLMLALLIGLAISNINFRKDPQPLGEIFQEKKQETRQLYMTTPGPLISNIQSTSAAISSTYSDQDITIRDKWREDKGYNIIRDDEYNSYTEETLNQLVSAGDTRAMIALAKKVYKNKGYQGARDMLENAIIHGSTSAIGDMARIEKNSNFSKARTPEEKQKSKIEVLAWCKLSDLRGDPRCQAIIGSSFIARSKITLSAEDIDQVNQQAFALYKELDARRATQNLAAFDNTVPDAVRKYYKQVGTVTLTMPTEGNTDN